jgi:hypothetical protein
MLWQGSKGWVPGVMRSLLAFQASSVLALVRAVSCEQLAQASAAVLLCLAASCLRHDFGSKWWWRSTCPSPIQCVHFVLACLRLCFQFGSVLGLHVLCCRLVFVRFPLSALHILFGVLHLVLHSLMGGFAPRPMRSGMLVDAVVNGRAMLQCG